MKQKIAILSLCFTGLIYLVITVSLAGMIEAFPSAGANTVKLAVSLPSLTGIFGIWMVPALAGKVKQKTLCIFALALISGAGLCGLFVYQNLWAILAASALIGFGYGITTTMYPVLIAGRYSGEKSAVMMGLGAGMFQLGRLITSLAAGVLAKRGWQWVFGAYFFAVLALILFAVLMPNDEKTVKKQPRDCASLKNPAVWQLACFGCLFACFYFVISTDSSVYIETARLGGPDLTGALSSLSCALAGVVAALFGRIYPKTGRFTLSLAFLLLAAGYLTAGAAVSLFGITIAFLCSAAAISLFTPWLMVAICPAANQKQAPVATALVLTVVNLGYTVSPYATGFLGKRFTAGYGAFFASGAAALLLFGISAAVFKKDHEKAR